MLDLDNESDPVKVIPNEKSVYETVGLNGTTLTTGPGVNDYSKSMVCLKTLEQAKIGGSMIRKRKSSVTSTVPSSLNGFDDDDDDNSSIFTVDTDDGKKNVNARVNHSEIEKRRRDKMNTYIMELAEMVPMCNAMNRKLDKLTVLRLAVQHMKSLSGAGDAHTEVSHKPNFLSNEELKHLILKSAAGFLFVASCDRGRFLYVSESVKNVLHYKQSEMIGQSLFDYLHPKDVSKVKEQLLSSDLVPRERFIDSKTMTLVKTKLPQKQSQLCSGARRSFFCRMKSNTKSNVSNVAPNVKTERDSEADFSSRRKNKDRKNFTLVHCTGYIKSWLPSRLGVEEENDDNGDNCNLNCLVAVGITESDYSKKERPFHDNTDINVRPREFLSRHTVDAKFSYVDHRATSTTGYLPQELLGTSLYEYCHQEDLNIVTQFHKNVLRVKDPVDSPPYRIKGKGGFYIRLRTRAFTFVNPWTKEAEYIVCTHSLLPSLPESGSSTSADQGIELLPPSESGDIKLTTRGSNDTLTAVASAGRIGRQVVEELYKDSSEQCSSSITAKPRTMDSSKPSSSAPPPGISTQATIARTEGNMSMESDLNAHPQQFTTDSSSGTDGHDEAAMAMIMTLLEADAGLGGPVDFSDLPWPL